MWDSCSPTNICDCLPLCTKGFRYFDQFPKALMLYDQSKSNFIEAMIAKKRKLHKRKDLDLSRNCQIYLSSHLHGQALYMTMVYMTSALIEKKTGTPASVRVHLTWKNLSLCLNLL